MGKPGGMVGLLLALALLSGWLISCAPENSTLPFRPHLDPTAAQADYNDAYLMHYISLTLDSVLANDPKEVGRLAYYLSFAGIRPEAMQAAGSFSQSASSLAGRMTLFRSDLDKLRSMLGQKRLDDAKKLAYAMLDRVPFAQDDLDQTEKSVEKLAIGAGVFKSDGGSEARTYYQDAVQELARSRKSIDVLLQFLDDRDAGALLKALQGAPELEAYIPLAQALSGIRPELQRTDLSLELAPQRAFVGDTVTFWGQLTSGSALAGREVALEVGGEEGTTVRTDQDGRYRGELTLPYRYADSVTIQANYLPVGADAAQYLAAVSSETEVQTPFYISSLHVVAPAKIYPGLIATVNGDFGYADPPFMGARKVDILIDGSPAGSLLAGEDFSAGITLDNNVNVGEHRISLAAPGQGRYGPASATATFSAAKAAPAIYVQTPRFLVVPWELEIRGKVESEEAPLNFAPIRLKFGQKTIDTTTAANGTFHYRLSPGLFSNLIGQQGLEVEATPAEPWNGPVSTRRDVWVFNPAGLAIILCAAAIAYYYVRSRAKSRNTGPSPAAVLQAPVTAAFSSVVAASAQEAGPPSTDAQLDEDRILRTYLAVVRFVASNLGIVVNPRLTLREQAQELTPRLGATSSYLWQMTLVVEKALYSLHSVTERDREDVERLSTQVTRGTMHGPS